MVRAFSLLSVGCVLLISHLDPAPTPARDDARMASRAEETGRAAESLARLRDPSLTPAQIDRYLRQLGRVQPTPRVLQELICWLEYDSFEAAQTGLYRGREGPDPKDSYPAFWALTELGPAAASAVVAEYVYIYDNTDPAARRGRITRGDGRNPEIRITLLRCLMTAKDSIAQRTVVEAQKLMAKEPTNAHIQKACGELVTGIVGKYSPRYQVRLFPGMSVK
jgi:hypothetical protein